MADERQYMLRPLEPKDVAGMMEWMHDRETVRYLRLKERPATQEDILAFISSAQSEKVNFHRAITNAEGKYLGTISLKNIDREKAEAEYAIAMHPLAQGTGAAYYASGEIFRIAFERLHLKRIYLNVMAANVRAVNFYKKLSAFGLASAGSTNTVFDGVEQQLLWYAVERHEYLNTRKKGRMDNGKNTCQLL